MSCRGLILDSKGEVVSRPFSKFFNFSEHLDQKKPLPAEDFEVTDKLDGSLGISYWHDGVKIATRGSFTSDQAIKANEILQKKYPKFQETYNPDYTYLWEIIYPANRIVVDYGEIEDLHLLTMVHTAFGIEVLYEFLGKEGFPVVQRFDGITDVTKIKEMARDNAEGFVIKYKSGLRLKSKYLEYCRLHKLLTMINSKTIWELLKNNDTFDELLERVPDEFYSWVKKTKDDLEAQFKKIEIVTQHDFELVKDMKTRKEQALFLQENSDYPGVVFALLDNKTELATLAIWKMLKPKAEKPFMEDIDA
jgi:RNA ligase